MEELTDIKQIQSRILAIASEVHSILVKNNIPYYMIGGTMLGAIRHKGFIPWDDDMDFGIPREYFDKAISILKKELRQDFQTLEYNSGDFTTEYAKIEDRNTAIIEIGRKNMIGLFIDIFPIDISANNNFGLFSRNRWVRELLIINLFKYYWPHRMIDKFIACFIRVLPENFAKRIALKIAYKKGNYRVNYAGAYREKEIIKSSYWGNPTLYDFENVQLYGPENYDSFLSCLYNDYMQLPPEDKRHSHIIKCYIKSQDELDQK